MADERATVVYADEFKPHKHATVITTYKNIIHGGKLVKTEVFRVHGNHDSELLQMSTAWIPER